MDRKGTNEVGYSGADGTPGNGKMERMSTRGRSRRRAGGGWVCLFGERKEKGEGTGLLPRAVTFVTFLYPYFYSGWIAAYMHSIFGN